MSEVMSECSLAPLSTQAPKRLPSRAFSQSVPSFPGGEPRSSNAPLRVISWCASETRADPNDLQRWAMPIQSKLYRIGMVNVKQHEPKTMRRRSVVSVITVETLRSLALSALLTSPHAGLRHSSGRGNSRECIFGTDYQSSP